MNQPAGMKPVGMGRNAAHGMHRNRPPGGFFVNAPRPIRPGDIERDAFLKGRVRKFGGDSSDGRGGNAGHERGLFRGIIFAKETPRQMLERGRGRASIGQGEIPHESGRNAGAVGVDECSRGFIEGERIAIFVTGKQAVVIGGGVADDKPMRVCVTDEIVEIDFFGGQQLMNQGRDQHAIGSGLYADPLVRNGVVPGAHRVDRYNLDALFLEFSERDLKGVGRVILGDAEEQKITGVLPVGLAELPKRAAESVKSGGGHVHGAEAAMSREIGSAELLSEPPRQRLALVAASEKRQLFRIGSAHVAKPIRGQLQRFVPGNFLIFA